MCLTENSYPHIRSAGLGNIRQVGEVPVGAMIVCDGEIIESQ